MLIRLMTFSVEPFKSSDMPADYKKNDSQNFHLELRSREAFVKCS